jgi:hypothetical protein
MWATKWKKRNTQSRASRASFTILQVQCITSNFATCKVFKECGSRGMGFCQASCIQTSNEPCPPLPLASQQVSLLDCTDRLWTNKAGAKFCSRTTHIHCWYQQHQQVNAFTSSYISVQVNDTRNKTPLGSHTLLSVPRTAPATSTGRCRKWSTRSSTGTTDGQSTLRLE